MDHGSLEYRECAGEDPNRKCGTPFPVVAKAQRHETVIFARIVYKSRAHHVRVNAKVMADPRLSKMKDPKSASFDNERMSFGGFEVMVEAMQPSH